MIRLSERIPLSEISSHIGKAVVVGGFVSRIRKTKSVVFLDIFDRDGKVQLTIKNNEIIKKLGNITLHSVVSAYGEVNKLDDGYEVLVSELDILSVASKPLPIDVVKETSKLDTRLNYRWVDLRSPKNRLIFKILSFFVNESRKYFIDNGFVEIFTPKLLSQPSEGGAEVFPVVYFNREAYLAQSPQFYKQMAIASSFDRVFEIAPVFRANPSFTSRHDTEYTSLDI